jgi:hypothetical protein
MREPDPRGVAWKKEGLVIGQHDDTATSRTFNLPGNPIAAGPAVAGVSSCTLLRVTVIQRFWSIPGMLSIG